MSTNTNLTLGITYSGGGVQAQLVGLDGTIAQLTSSVQTAGAVTDIASASIRKLGARAQNSGLQTFIKAVTGSSQDIEAMKGATANLAKGLGTVQKHVQLTEKGLTSLVTWLSKTKKGATPLIKTLELFKKGASSLSGSLKVAQGATEGLSRSFLPFAAIEGAINIFKAGKAGLEAYGAGQEAAAAKTRNSAEAMAIYQKQLLPAQDELKKLGIDLKNVDHTSLKQVLAALVKLNSAARKARQSTNAMINNKPVSAPKTGNTNGASYTTIVPQLSQQGAKKALNDAQQLTQQLRHSFDNQFTRISDRYVQTWQNLADTYGSNSAKVKNLESAYQQWVNQQWAKQEASAQAQAAKVISLQSAKYARLHQLAQQSNQDKRQLAIASQNADLKSMEQERQRLTKNNQWNDNLDAQYQQARKDRAKITADQLKKIDADEKQKRLEQMQAFHSNALGLKQSFHQLSTNASQVNISKLTSQLSQFHISQVKWEKMTSEQKLNVVQSGLTALSGLMASHNRKMFEVGKAAAIANAVISTYSAAQKAYDSLAGIPIIGPALGAAAAAAAIAAGIQRVKKIESTKFGSGGASGGAGAATSSISAPSASASSASGPTSVSSQAPTQQQQPKSTPVQVNIYQTGNADQFVKTQVIPMIKDQVKNADVQIISTNSRNAQDIAAMAATQRVAA